MLMLAPALIVLGGLCLGGLTVAVFRSLNVLVLTGEGSATADAYVTVLQAPEFLRSLGFSLYIAGLSTFLSTVLGVAAALLLRQRFAGRGVVAFLFQLTLTLPHLIAAIGMLYLLSQSGLLARIAFALGAIGQPSDFPALVYDRAGIGIILQFVWKEVPFVALIVLAQMQTLGQDFESVARTLGASRWQSFRHVLLPMILPAVVAASLLVFAFTLGAYETPLLLGPNAPATLPVLAYRKFIDVDLSARAEAMALAVIIAVIGLGLTALYVRATSGGGHIR